MQRIAFVGAGGLGTRHARLISGLPNAQITGVMDIRPEAAKTLAEAVGASAYTDFDAMLREVACDAVYIATPTPMHHPYCLAAAKAGKNVITEKPLARTMEQGREMIAACEEAGVGLYVAHVLRWFPEFSAAHHQVKAGAVGNPAVIRSTRGGNFPRASQDWYADYAQSGGVTLDAVVHDFDWLLWTFGPVERVFCNGLVPRNLLHKDYSLTTLRFKSGAIAHVEGTWAHFDGFRVELEVAGDAGMLEFKSRNVTPLAIVRSQGADAAAGVAVPESPLAMNPYQAEDEHFLHCMETGAECLVKPREALAAIEVALAALESAATGQPVTLKGGE